MSSIKRFLLFTNKYFVQIQRKWLSLPFLLFLPIIFAGLIVLLVLTFFIQEDQVAMQVGIVDLDQSDETILLTSLLEESSQLSSLLELDTMSEIDAIKKVESDELSGYITFPKDFTANLYTGDSVNLSITGNPKKQMDSFMLNEFVNSIIRQIRDSQANILTLNYFANEAGMNAETRSDFVFEQFKDFLFFTLGRETIINDREVVNQATSSPLHYYGISSWFMLTTVWCVIIYLFLTKEETPLIKTRIRLYGVTHLQQITAKIFVIFLSTIVLSLPVFLLVYYYLKLQIVTENIIRVGITASLYYICLILMLAIIEIFISQEKLRILFQTSFTGILLLLSGAIVPTIYFPLWLEEKLFFLYPYEAFIWLTEILLNDRYYVDYVPLSMIGLALGLILIAMSLWRERVTE